MNIDIKRGYEILPDSNVVFGIRITNNTTLVISDVQVILDYNESLFSLQEDRVLKIGSIPPTTAQTAKFTLKPTGCILSEKIEASIIYRDPKWEKHMLDMRPKEVHCICPFLHEKTITKNEFLQLSSTLYTIDAGMSFEGISAEQITSFLMQTCATHLYIADGYTIPQGNVLHFSGESAEANAHYLLTALIKENEGLTQTMFRAASDKKNGVDGFLHEIISVLRHFVNTANYVKDIEFIKREQVSTILDSLVPRSNLSPGTMEPPVNIRKIPAQQSDTHPSQSAGTDTRNNSGGSYTKDVTPASVNGQTSQEQDIVRMYDSYLKDVRSKQKGNEKDKTSSPIPYARNPAPSDRKINIPRGTVPSRKKEEHNPELRRKSKKKILMQMLTMVFLIIAVFYLMQIPMIRESIGGNFGGSGSNSDEVETIVLNFLTAVNESEYNVAFNMYEGKDFLVPASVQMLFDNGGIEAGSIRQIDVVSKDVEDDTAVMTVNCTAASVNILGNVAEISVITVYFQLHDLEQGWTVTAVSFIKPFEIESGETAEVVSE